MVLNPNPSARSFNAKFGAGLQYEFNPSLLMRAEADSLFTFDKVVVRPEGRIALDKFAQELRGTKFDVIVGEGHTDRIGSAAYNQRLSAQRAEAVKAYLIISAGLLSQKISVVGKGETAPETKDCVGNKPNPKLIACLQPDRRVEVEVTGTR